MSEAFDDSTELYFNGINGATGEYGVRPQPVGELAKVVVGDADDEPDKDLQSKLERRADPTMSTHYAPAGDPTKLSENGWAVVFPASLDGEYDAIKEALKPLLDLRRAEAGEYFRIFEGGDGFRPKDSTIDWLVRQGVAYGPVDETKVPYYLLIVGGPDKIPYSFQSELDVVYAVGRLDFGDDVEAYYRYAVSVVMAETREGAVLPRKATFFSVENEDDRATQMSSEHLVSPILRYLDKKFPKWQRQELLKDKAYKKNLLEALSGDEAPALLFTASHGMEFPLDHPLQLRHQGALLCQDWPGPRNWKEAIPQDHYFAGEDLPQDANLMGMIGFFFACYGAGTPLLDEYAKQAYKEKREKIAPHAFLADLPTRMLSNPGGGALAMIGHVERAWGCSFIWPGAGSQTNVFEKTLKRVLEGDPIGYAFDLFNERYAQIGTSLNSTLEEYHDPYGRKIPDNQLVSLWTANNDARGYVILGDPFVRLKTAENGKDHERPALEINFQSPVTSSAKPKEVSEPAKAAAPPAPEKDAPPAAEQTSQPLPSADEFTFGIFGGGKGEKPGPIHEFMNKMGDFLVRSVENVSTLQVDTWESQDGEDVHYEDGEYKGARLSASTRIDLDGDFKVLVPKKPEGIDEAIWEIHLESLKQAQEARAATLNVLIETYTHFFKK